MVHSDLIFWSVFSCKRRRFLSDLRTSPFPGQPGQDRFWPVLSNSGGPSLPSLASWSAGLKPADLPPESGNIGIRLLASGGPSKRSFGLLDGAVTCPVRVQYGGGWWYSARRAPPIKVAGALFHDFAGIQEAEIPYRI